MGGDDDLGRLGRERGGVLEQLGEQVDGVGHGIPADPVAQRDVEDDPVVLLDLGDRGLEHVHQGYRLGPVPGCLVAREDERAV